MYSSARGNRRGIQSRYLKSFSIFVFSRVYSPWGILESKGGRGAALIGAVQGFFKKNEGRETEDKRRIIELGW